MTIKSTWQWYAAARRILGMDVMQQIYGNVNARQVYRWAADPDFCAEHQRNPLDRLGRVLDMLCERGRADVARAAVSMLAMQADCAVSYADRCPLPDRSTLAEELLDDLPALAAYHRVLMHPGSTPVEIRQAREHAVRELDENEAAALRGREGEGHGRRCLAGRGDRRGGAPGR